MKAEAAGVVGVVGTVAAAPSAKVVEVGFSTRAEGDSRARRRWCPWLMLMCCFPRQ